MDFALSVEQQDLAAAEKAWLQKHDPILERRESIDLGRPSIPASARKHSPESGLAGLLTSEIAATNVDLGVLVEAHGWAGSALPLAEIAISTALLEEAGDPDWEVVSAGDQIVIPVLASHSSCFDVEVNGDGLRIQGASSPATGLGDADRILFVARTNDGRDVAAAIPARDLVVNVLDTLDVLRPWAVAEIDLTLAAGQWTNMPAGTTAKVAEQIATFRAVDALGCADRLLGMTIEYAGQRSQFGRPIGSFQAVKHHVANMALAVDASRSILWAAELALDEDDVVRRTRAVSAAVAFTCESANRIAQLALQVHGGIGFTWEHDVHLLVRRIKVDGLLDGSVSDHRRRIVETLETA